MRLIDSKNHNKNNILKKSGQSITKAQLAEILQCSQRTLERWMNDKKENFERLSKLGYTKHQRILTPEMVRVIYPEWILPNFKTDRNRQVLDLSLYMTLSLYLLINYL